MTVKKKNKKSNIYLVTINVLIAIQLIAIVSVYLLVSRTIRTGETIVNTSDELEDTVDEVVINNAIATSERLTGYTNIALIGIDTRDGNIDYSNSDTMLVVSINNDTWGVRMISLYRDTYLNIDPDSETEKYNRANAAYATGSINQFLSMLNTNLDLNITQYIIVDFNALATLIDDLGGINIMLTEQEVVHLNNYCIETSEITGRPYSPLEYEEGMEARVYTLNGVQSVSYTRILFTDGYDMKRTQRQRLVIEKIVEKAKAKGIDALSLIINDVFPKIKTNFTSSQLIKMTALMINYNIEYTSGFPFEYLEADIAGKNVIVPVTLEDNVKELHEFLFDDTSYHVSANVKHYSDIIISESGLGSNYKTTAKGNGVIPDIGSEADLAK